MKKTTASTTIYKSAEAKGVEAFERGNVAAPALDEWITQRFETGASQKSRTHNQKLMRAWLKGWHGANVAA